MRYITLLQLAALFTLSTLGCSGGDAGPTVYEVNGSVSMDGVPVDEGEIIFRAIDPPGRSYAGKIEKGRFRFDSSAGKKRIEITGYKENPNQGQVAESGEEEPTMIMHIPPKYSIQSELIRQVDPEGSREFELKLTSDGE